jgi:hypothetical protein
MSGRGRNGGRRVGDRSGWVVGLGEIGCSEMLDVDELSAS